MVRRKVIKQANQAHTITLPIDWIRDNNIKAGKELEVIQSERSLIIKSDNKTKFKSVKFSAGNLSEVELYMHINALYARGVDELEIISKKDISTKIMKALNQNMGYTLISQSGNEYIIRDISGTSYEDLDGIFKRVFQFILAFYDSAIEDIFGKEEATIPLLKARDVEVNKLTLFLQRAINKKSYPEATNGRILFTYSFELEKISDEILRIWRTNVNHKVKKTKDVRKIIDLSKKSLEKAFSAYYQFSPGTLREIKAIREEVRKLSLKITGDASTIRFVKQALKLTEEVNDLNHLVLMRKLCCYSKLM